MRSESRFASALIVDDLRDGVDQPFMAGSRPMRSAVADLLRSFNESRSGRSMCRASPLQIYIYPSCSGLKNRTSNTSLVSLTKIFLPQFQHVSRSSDRRMRSEIRSPALFAT